MKHLSHNRNEGRWTDFLLFDILPLTTSNANEFPLGLSSISSNFEKSIYLCDHTFFLILSLTNVDSGSELGIYEPCLPPARSLR